MRKSIPDAAEIVKFPESSFSSRLSFSASWTDADLADASRVVPLSLFRLKQQLQQTREPIQDGSPKGRPLAGLAYVCQAFGFRERISSHINSQAFKCIVDYVFSLASCRD